MSEYLEQAERFLRGSGTEINIVPAGVVDGFPLSDDDKPHNKYKVTLTRGTKSYTFPFYDSYHNFTHGIKPNSYDVLASVQSYPIQGDMWEFAKEFGYKIDSEESYKRVRKIWLDCKNQYDNLAQLFGLHFIKELAEIQ